MLPPSGLMWSLAFASFLYACIFSSLPGGKEPKGSFSLSSKLLLADTYVERSLWQDTISSLLQAGSLKAAHGSATSHMHQTQLLPSRALVQQLLGRPGSHSCPLFPHHQRCPVGSPRARCLTRLQALPYQEAAQPLWQRLQKPSLCS